MFLRKLTACGLVLTGLLACAPAVFALTITPDKDNRWLLDGGPIMGTRGLTFPALLNAEQKTAHKLIERQTEGKKVILKYEGGARIEAVAGSEGITFTFSDVPTDVRFYQMSMLIPMSFIDGGSWAFGQGAAQPFPREKPQKAQLFQGGAASFTLRHPQGRALAFTHPSEFTFNQLQDNREWGTKVFQWIFITPYQPELSRYELKITDQEPAAAAKPAVMVDEFGQNATADFPEKVKSVAELSADVEAEKAYYASLNPPAVDAYGGLPGSGAKLGLKATGFFHVEQKGERWYLVNPEGNLFFHLGVSSFAPMQEYTYVTGREQVFRWLPPSDGEYASAYMPGSGNSSFSFHLANLKRKYGRSFTLGEYQTLMFDRVRKWGFNAIGAFSPLDHPAITGAKFPYMRELPLNAYSGMPIVPGVRETFDPFDDRSRERATKAMARLAEYATDPLLIGYYLSNEPALEDLPRAIPSLGGKYACKRRLVQMLESKYSTVEALNQAWEMTASSFEELNDKGLPIKTRAASEDMQQFTAVFLDEYYRFVRDAVRQVDANHMLIGNRLQTGTINNEQLCRTAAKYLDAFSYNYYTYSLDKSFLKRIYSWTGKPMFLSEFYWGSPADSGLPGGVKDVASQAERGLAYRNYVEQGASLGFVVGVEWYTLMDMCYSGVYYMKYGGDNANCGLISITDRPWKVMLKHMMQTNYSIYQVLLGERPAFAYEDPRYLDVGPSMKTAKIYRAGGTMTVDGVGDNWPNVPSEVISPDRVVEGADGGSVQATFKLCWDERNLYLLMTVKDPTPMQNQLQGAMLYAADAIELFTGQEKPDQGGALLFTDRQVLLGAGKEPRWHFVNQATQSECQLAVVPEVDGSGYTLEAAIPMKSLSIDPAEGREIRFDLGVDDSSDGRGRLRQLMWNGVARNPGDRTHWGRAVFVR